MARRRITSDLSVLDAFEVVYDPTHPFIYLEALTTKGRGYVRLSLRAARELSGVLATVEREVREHLQSEG